MGVACLFLLIWFVVQDAPIPTGKVRAHSAKADRGEAGTPVSPEGFADADAGPLVEPGSALNTMPEPTNSTTGEALVNVAKLQKTPAISNRADALASRSFSIVNIEPTFLKSPVYVLSNAKGKPFAPRTWLRVVVSFRSPSARIAELSFRYKISIAEQMFTGTMAHAEILGEGEHQVAAFVIPSVVESAIKGRDLAADNIVKVEVEAINGEVVLARSQVGRVLGAARKTRPDLLRSVEKTPFAPLESDLYEPTAE